MISEVLSLGIKGADLVAGKLKEIQKQKAALSRPAKVPLSIMQKLAGVAAVGAALALARPQPGSEGAKAAKEAREKKTRSGPGLDETALGLAQGASSLDATSTAQSALTGIGAMFGPQGAFISGIASAFVGAASAFTDKIQNAAKSWADTTKIANTAQNFAGRENFLRGPGERTDISRSEQAHFIQGLGARFGRFDAANDEFRKSVSMFFNATNKQNQKLDAEQAAQLTQGNFSALGTDKGFFLQKISDSIAGLPPSLQKALQPQLLGMISPEERMVQHDLGARQTTTGFDEMNRGQQAQLLRDPNAISNAATVQNLQNKGEALLIEQMSKLITAIEKLVNLFSTPGNLQDKGKFILRAGAAASTGGMSEILPAILDRARQ